MYLATVRSVFAMVCVLAPALAFGASYDCLIEPEMTIKLGSPATGIIDEIPVDRGDEVKKGEVVARLESDLERTELEMAKTKYGYLKSQYERLKVVRSKSLASDEIVDQAKSQMDSAKLEMRRREILLRERSIKSPVNAIVVDRLLAPGEYVYEQTPILKLAKTDTLNVQVLLPTDLYRRVKEGMDATVTLQAPVKGTYHAKVKVIDKIMDAASSSFGVELTLKNPNLSIPAGLRCNVTFAF